MSNRLAQETSPYLLQHKDNPVEWYPWGEEAFIAARELDRPLLISIGYSACHWCHVMERESFEDPVTAALMNANFVCVKVDREERPDVDSIYMEAVQAMAGHGGWPLHMFVTPDQVPFYGGTYFPPEPRQGLPSWQLVLEAVAAAWKDRRSELLSQGEQLATRLAGAAELEASDEPITDAELTLAVEQLRQQYDERNGGFAGAPKFPMASVLDFLLRRDERSAQAMALETLRNMARGGIYDQVGGGFARYSVDAHWIVPHFEKMLYDNALLARTYLHAYQVSNDKFFARICQETLDWALREMRGPEGGFYSALDADSEGVEGKFYVWTPAELRAALDDPELADEAIHYFGVSEAGNFEGLNILTAAEAEPARLGELRCKLFDARDQRVRPDLDDKRLAAWNALMISALADAGAALKRPDYLAAATGCADFVLRQLRDPSGRLLRSYNNGQAKLNGYLEDHAFLLEALLSLYEATFDPRWFNEARELADTIIERFGDSERGGFFTTANDHEKLVVRRKELDDSPIPAGGSSAAYGLLRLAALSGEASYEQQAVGVLRLLHQLAAQHPTAFGHLLQAIDFYLAPTQEVALVGPGTDALAGVVRTKFRPHLVLAGGSDREVSLLQGRTAVKGSATAYVCERFVCQAPVTDPTELAALLD